MVGPFCGYETHLKQVLVLVCSGKLVGRNVGEGDLEEGVDFQVVFLWSELPFAGSLRRKLQ